MPLVTYIHADGASQQVSAPVGISLMKAAVTNDVPGIVGECGGSAVCATCHVYVEASNRPLPGPSPDEDEMLDWTAAPRQEGSRLSCQLVPTTDDAEITVRIPEEQA